MTPVLHTQHRQSGEGGSTSRVQTGYSASRLSSDELRCQGGLEHSDAPSKAIKNEVLPEPVGPTMRFIRPCFNCTSASIRSTKFLLDRLGVPGDTGVETPWFSFVQVNAALRMPMMSRVTMVFGIRASASCDSAEYSSSSSV